MLDRGESVEHMPWCERLQLACSGKQHVPFTGTVYLAISTGVLVLVSSLTWGLETLHTLSLALFIYQCQSRMAVVSTAANSQFHPDLQCCPCGILVGFMLCPTLQRGAER